MRLITRVISRFAPIMVVALGLLSQTATAQDQIKVRPTSRLMIDGALFKTKDVTLREGIGVRDFRVGFKAYYQKWYIKTDIGLSKSHVAFKSLFIQHNFSKSNFLRVGYYMVPFGVEYAYGSIYEPFTEEPLANIFYPGKRLGIMHSTWSDKLWLAYGLFGDRNAQTMPTDKTGDQGFSALGRLVYRPINSQGKLFQIGLSYGYFRADGNGIDKEGKDNSREFNFETNYLTSIDQTRAIDALVDHAVDQHKICVELLATHHNLAIESEAYYTLVNRDKRELNSFKGYSFYVTGKYLLYNPTDYKYSQSDAGLVKPCEGQVELVLNYDFINTNDKKANVYGGQLQDISAGLSYYLNKHISLRANYAYIMVNHSNNSSILPRVHALQCRLQYNF